MNFINENQMYRFQILWELYKQTNADIDQAYDLRELSNQIGIGNRSFQAAYKYLYMQDLISMRPASEGNGGNMSSNYMASITHRGIKAVEEAFRFANKATEYFPAYREMMM